MPNPLLGQLTFTILPGKPPFRFLHEELYDRAYEFWLFHQKSVRAEVGLPTETLHSDDFTRHDFVNVLVYQGSIIALMNSMLLDFTRGPAVDHSYIKRYFGKELVERIRGAGLKRIGTLENIACDKDWRSARMGLSLGAVVMALGLNRLKAAGCDGAIGAARVDAPSARITYDLGAQALLQGLHFHGKSTDLVIFPACDTRPHPSEDVNRLAARLWAGRLDATAGHATPLDQAQRGDLS